MRDTSRVESKPRSGAARSLGLSGWAAAAAVGFAQPALAQTGVGTGAPPSPAAPTTGAATAPAQPAPAAAATAPTAPVETAPRPAPAPPAQVASTCFPACRAGYLCHEGQCVSACNPPCAASEVCTSTGACEAAPSAVAPPAASAPAAAPGGAPAAPASEALPTPEAVPHGVNLHVNALGLLEWGLIPRVEIGGSTTVLVGAHFFATGLLSYVLLTGDNEDFDYGYGGNWGARHYFNSRGAQAGGYLGGLLEYATFQTTDPDDDPRRLSSPNPDPRG
jgi:hypothetical protein